MSANDNVDELVIKALSNKERKNILKIVASHPGGINYTGILSETGLSTGRLNYHLGELDGFLARDEEKLYTLSDLGKKALAVQDYIDQNIDVSTIRQDTRERKGSPGGIFEELGNRFNFLNRVHFSVFLIIGLVLGGAIGAYSGLRAREVLSSIEDEIGSLSTLPNYGVNYLSTFWHYDLYYLSDAELKRDFSLFESEGFSNITLPLIWNYTEPELGVYSDFALRDIVRVCDAANAHGLGVIIDFHTLMHPGSYTMPDWLAPRNFEAVIANNSYREAWLDYLAYCVSFLSNETSNIHSWHMMNEPAIGEWACNVTIKEFTSLWREMREVIKTYSDRPVSIRFGSDTISSHFNYTPEIFEVCDYVSLNWFGEHVSIESLREMVANITLNGDDVVISEFGLKSSDVEQANKIKEYTELFLDLGIDEWYAWLWRADHPYGDPEPPGVGYNLAKNDQGEPRLAFYFLVPRNTISTYKDALENILLRVQTLP